MPRGNSSLVVVVAAGINSATTDVFSVFFVATNVGVVITFGIVIGLVTLAVGIVLVVVPSDVEVNLLLETSFIYTLKYFFNHIFKLLL